MRKICKLISGGLVMVMMAGLKLDLAEAEDTMACYMTKLTVDNLSNQTVRIRELRWLNSTGDSWLKTSADSGEIATGGLWQTEFCMTGLDGGSTFISILYDIKLNKAEKVWSNDHLGKQVHVQLDRTPVMARLDIARRNLRTE